MSLRENLRSTPNNPEFEGLLGSDDEFEFIEYNVKNGETYIIPEGYTYAFELVEESTLLYRREKANKSKV
jgi:hypothetical protein